MAEVEGPSLCGQHTSCWGTAPTPPRAPHPGTTHPVRSGAPSQAWSPQAAAGQWAGGGLWLHLPAASGHLLVPGAGSPRGFLPRPNSKWALAFATKGYFFTLQNTRPSLRASRAGNHLA
ncbi:hypothetical protein VULLAG_LOCUS19541 [Vulpes lagopus]